MKKLFLLSLLLLSGMSYVSFTAEEKTEQQPTKEKQVEAVTTATPKPNEKPVSYHWDSALYLV